MHKFCSLLAIFIFLTGCKSSILTTIQVTENSHAHAVISLTLTGPTAAAVHDSPNLAKALNAIFIKNLGSLKNVKKVKTADSITWSTNLSLRRLPLLASLTSVSSVDIKDFTVFAELSNPSELQAAIENFPDTAARPALKEFIEISLAVKFPGEIVHTGGTLPVEISGSTAKTTQTLGSFTPGTIIVKGSASSSSIVPYILVGMALVSTIVLVVSYYYYPRKSKKFI